MYTLVGTATLYVLCPDMTIDFVKFEETSISNHGLWSHCGVTELH